MSKKLALCGCAVLILLLNPLTAKWLETNMLTYMLVQIPGLVAGGYLIGSAMRTGLKGYNSGGIPGLLLASFIISYWMLPRSLDAAIESGIMNVFKYVSLPALAGIPLAWSWPQLGPIARGFVWSNVISMLLMMGWLYMIAPVRLCNNFLERQQYMLGQAMLLIGLVLTIYFVLQVFTGNGSANAVADENETNAQGP